MQRNPTIAVIDDDSSVLKALGRLLSDCGYNTELFASAGEFLTAAPTSEAACLLVDVGLGDMSGLEMVSRLSVAGFKFPFIFMSGFADDEFRTQAKALGCITFLQKPFAPDLLIAVLKKTFESDLPSESNEPV